MKKKILAYGIFLFSIAGFFNSVSADSLSINFENPPYDLGSIHTQDGWSSLGSVGSGCAIYDHSVDSSLLIPGFDSQSLRISNAVTSGCFGDQTFSKSLSDEVGEASALNGGMSGGVRQPHFEVQFDIASTVPNSQQPGLFLSVSPDRGDGARMSYIGFEDKPTGINVIFYDVQGVEVGETAPCFQCANFVLTDLGTYDRSAIHTIKLTFDAIDGASNDVVKVYVNGVLKHTGGSWEDYYTMDTESNPVPPMLSRTVDSILFRSGGTSAPSTSGKGFLIDNLSLMSGPIPPVNPFPVPAECNQNIPYNLITGTNGSNNINGTNGSDLILALGGSDRVDGKGGDDCIVGGDGSDRLTGANGADVILGGNGSDSIDGGNQNDDLYGQGGSDSISGGNHEDDLFGGDASDSLRGGNHNDNLLGGDGSDSLRGEGGNDTLDGEGGMDSANGGPGGSDSCTAEAESACEI